MCIHRRILKLRQDFSKKNVEVMVCQRIMNFQNVYFGLRWSLPQKIVEHT